MNTTMKCILIITLVWISFVYAEQPFFEDREAVDIQLTAVSKDEAMTWIQYVVPLPKQIEILGKITLMPKEIAIAPPRKSTPIIEQTLQELRATVGSTKAEETAVKPTFVLTLQLGSTEAQKLQTLDNSNQAYRIFPETDYQGLRLVALSPRGLYYAGKTLQKLIQAHTTEDQVKIPIIRVIDWPDMEDRGLWGSDSYLWLKWMGERKMNIEEQISFLSVDNQGEGHARLKTGREPMVEEGPLYGVKPVPVVLHLEQLSGKGIFEAYPELRAQGGEEGAICYSQPAIVDVLADWIVELGNLHGVESVDVWLTENLHGKGGCQCPQCRKHNRDLLETRAVLAGWKQAKKRIGNIGLRILSSEETDDSNALILREIPPEVKFWYYHSLFTYTSRETPMIKSEIANAARAGHWVGVCPSLVSKIGFTQPFTGAQFIHYRMNEFVDKNISGFIGYATPRIRYARFNVEAAAEWSWNAKGRSPHEFALSWAVRKGIDNPEKFAEWSDTIGPVAWDVYGSEWPGGETRHATKPVARKLRNGTLPELGFVKWGVFPSPWGDIKSPEQLDSDVDAARRAVKLARELGVPQIVQESLIIQGYINSLKALWNLKSLVSPEGVAPENRKVARNYFEMYLDALEQAAEALPKWAAVTADSERFVEEPIKVIERMGEQMKKTAAVLGFDLDTR